MQSNTLYGESFALMAQAATAAPAQAPSVVTPNFLNLEAIMFNLREFSFNQKQL